MNGTRVGLCESTRSMITLSGHGRNTVKRASNNIATKATHNCFQYGRSSGRKCSIQSLIGIGILEDQALMSFGPVLCEPGTADRSWRRNPRTLQKDGPPGPRLTALPVTQGSLVALAS